MDLFDSSPNAIPRVWYDDGNLIIEAGSSRFRIYKGLLADKSSFFSTMLSLPQDTSEKLVDGCPVVRFQDSVQDVGIFLKAIYDPCFFEPPPSKTHPTILASILRLSTKYEVLYLRRRALQHLERIYPLTLDDFDRREERRTYTPISNAAFFPAIARELHFLWLLPSMLYCACGHPLPKIASGFEWNGKLIQMAPVDRDACLDAIIVLINREHNDILDFPRWEVADACNSQERCQRARLNILEHSFVVDPLGAKFDDQFKDYVISACKACVEESKDSYSRERQRLWDDLPELFGLPPWNKLVEMRSEAFDP